MATEVAQLSLFGGEVTPTDYHEPTLEERFTAFHREHAWVYQAIVDEVLRQRSAGVKRIGVKRVVENLRADPAFQTGDKPYAFNNSYTSFYARKLIREFPLLRDHIEIRGAN